MKIIWYMFLEIWSATDMIFSHFGPTSPPLSTNKTQNFEKMKKMPENIIISHKCSINNNHMYDSWDMKHNQQNFLSFWAIFCPFTSLTAENTKMKKKKMKKAPGDIIILHKCSKIMIICYTVPEICHLTNLIIFHFGPFFALLPS